MPKYVFVCERATRACPVRYVVRGDRWDAAAIVAAEGLDGVLAPDDVDATLARLTREYPKPRFRVIEMNSTTWAGMAQDLAWVLDEVDLPDEYFSDPATSRAEGAPNSHPGAPPAVPTGMREYVFVCERLTRRCPERWVVPAPDEDGAAIVASEGLSGVLAPEDLDATLKRLKASYPEPRYRLAGLFTTSWAQVEHDMGWALDEAVLPDESGSEGGRSGEESAEAREEGSPGNYGVRLGEALHLAATDFAGRFRTGTSVPYVSHLLQVAAWVAEQGGDEDQVIAGALHDWLEDIQSASAEVLEEHFGARVRRIVEALTDHSGYGERPPWRERKEAYLEHLRGQPAEVKLVAACDKLHNARCIAADLRMHGDAIWERFSGGKAGVLWYYRGLVGALGEGWAHPLVLRLGEAVAEIEELAG